MLRKTISEFPALLMDLPAESSLVPEIKQHRRTLSELAERFPGYRTFFMLGGRLLML